MNALEVIHRQNAEVQLRHLREKWIGQWVEAISTSNPATLVVGTVQDVLINNNRFEYQLAGRVGHFVDVVLANLSPLADPTVVKAPPATVGEPKSVVQKRQAMGSLRDGTA